MTTRRTTKALAACVLLSAGAGLFGAETPGPKAKAFGSLHQKIQTDPGGATEKDVGRLLQLGKELGAPYTASLAVRGYLSHHARPSPALLRAAAENALWTGDYRAAAARYKRYLQAAGPSEQACEAAADLYTVLIDFLRDADGAYQYMTQTGLPFRRTASVRRFDSWYARQARKRKDYASLARFLAAVLAEKMPLEKERLYFWDQLDWLMQEISRAAPEQYDALPHCRKLVGLIRGSRRRSLRYGFHVAHLAFGAASAGKEPGVLATDFERAVSPAKAYFDAFPSAGTLQDIFLTFAGGSGTFSAPAWGRQQAQKQKFFVYAFDKLRDEDRAAMMSWSVSQAQRVAGHLATPQQWTDLAIRHRALFARSEATRHVPFVRRAEKADLFRKLAGLLKGVGSYDAAVVNSLAAGRGDLGRCVDHLLGRETWHLSYASVFRAFEADIWPAFKALHAKDKEKTSPACHARALIRLGDGAVLKSPVALFDPLSAQKYLRAVWDHSEDKSEIIKRLDALRWVPWTDRQRKQAIAGAQAAFRSWALQVSRAARGKDAKANPQVLKRISPIAAAFKRASDPAGADPRKAPNALCRNMALAVAAAKAGRDSPQFVKAARQVYKLVADYDVKRTPYGRNALSFILDAQGRKPRRDVDFVCEVLADQLARYTPTGPNLRIRKVVADVMWPYVAYRHIRPEGDFKKINAVFAKAMMAQLEKGRFWPALFEWFRQTRAGTGWQGLDWGQQVMARIVDQKVFHKTDWRPVPTARSATVAYMRLLAREFPGLNGKYPVSSHFDDMFVAEATRTGWLDWRYWEFGRDGKKKVVNAAAKILQGHSTLPFGYNGEKVAYARGHFWSWQGRAFSAAPPVRDAMMARVESAYGKTRFDAYAMGRQYFSALADASTGAGRKAFFGRLGKYLDRAGNAHDRLPLPYLGQLDSIPDPAKLSKAELDVLVSIFPARSPSAYGRGWNCEKLVDLIGRGMIAQHRQNELYPLIPHFWKIARDIAEPAVLRVMVALGKHLRAGKFYDLAHVFASQGLDRYKGVLTGEPRAALLAVRSRALAEIGGVIPVRKSDFRYPLFAAQASYLTGKFQRARNLYMANRTRTLRMFKDLDPRFCIWLIDQDTEIGQYASAEALARALSQWFDSVGRDFEPEIRGRLELSFANIFFARQEYPIAGARYRSIAADRQFQATPVKGEAELKLAEVYRLTKRYDLAAAELEKLAQRPDKLLQAQAHYQLALVKFDQEEYREAREMLEKVFVIAPDDSDARILEGKVYLKLKRVELATEIEAGTPTRKNFLVPGAPLVVRLIDQNLSILGASTNVEVRAWSDSGDEEFFSLNPFGESKTKFRGKLPTALAPIAKTDGVLQVLGGEQVHFDFSEAVKRAKKIAVATRNTLTVVTDAEVQASSSTILTRDQRERLALERLIRSRLDPGGEPPAPDVALATLRQANQVKPGNPINVRVIDADRSTTPRPDAVAVKVATSSGDSIAAFALSESGTHTGVFGGSVPTASGHATAYASDTQDGKDANFAISSKDYGPWVAQADNVRPKTFSVDLNDNVALGKMNILADVTLRKLTSFLVQTSLNGRDFTTVAAWPKPHQPWDGSLRMELVRFDGEKTPSKLEEVKHYLEDGYGTSKQRKCLVKAAGPSISLSYGLAGQADRMGLGRHDVYIARLSGAFYQPMRRTRTFQLVPKDDQAGRRLAQYFLTVDGKGPRRAARSGEPETVTLSLGKGVHRIDIYVVARRSGKKQVAELMWDIDKAPYMAVCDPEAFDLAKHPEIREGIRRPAGQVAADKDGTSFDVVFPPELNARVIRLKMLDFETDAPAIRRIAFHDRGGKRILPIQQDFMTLRKNGILEIVPGDKITITYQDPTVLTEGKEAQEVSLTATYSNATISACFVEYQMDPGGRRRPRYIPMRRFGAKDKIQVFINDPDMDVSDKLDTVKFAARASDGEPIERVALETGKHTGVFLGAIFPVSGTMRRPSELIVKPGDDVVLTYRDHDNTDPGIPWERGCLVEQVYFKTPELWVYDVRSEPLEEQPKARRPRQGSRQLADEDVETVPATRRLVVTRPEKLDPAAPATAMIGGPCLLELLFPTIAKSPESTATIFVQTSAGRRAYGKAIEQGKFDIKVPGTIRLTARPGEVGGPAAPPGYAEVIVQDKRAKIRPAGRAEFTALDDGRFSFSIPLELGAVPQMSLAVDQPDPRRDPREEPKLMIKGDDEVYVGFRYADKDGKARWVTHTIRLDADAFFHAMDRRYQKEATGLYVGQKAYFRIIDPRRDTSDREDRVTIELSAASGTGRKIELIETFKHSGAFKGLVHFGFAGAEEGDEPDSMPVKYGDTVTARYRAEGKDAIARQIEIFKGSDGLVLPFSKRFKDPDIAMQTQFMVAEAYLELAKRHRALGEDSAARREIAQGKKLLEEAIRDYPTAKARAQSECLLADLALEFANDAKNEQVRKNYYNEAINRFSNVVASYPDSEYAPKAQYRKALTLEKMNRFDDACEEYVKLSYRYPDSELVAETIARLGQYFMTKGKGLRDQAGKEKDAVRREAVDIKARKMYKTAGQVLGRLGQRFPDHQLAGKTSVLSAQCFMHAEEYDVAVEVFEKVIKDPKQDPQLVAEAMYWCGDSYLKLASAGGARVRRRRPLRDKDQQLDPVRKAFQLFKRLDWDFPTTKWAKFARGRLASDEQFEGIED